MKKLLLLCFFLGTLLSLAQSESQNTPEQLMGTWKVDLRPTPDAPDYYQEFIVNSVASKALKGTFYGSDIESGLINTEWNRIYFAFTTADQSNTYYHSGYLEAGKLLGISYCPGRSFVARWVAEKTTN